MNGYQVKNILWATIIVMAVLVLMLSGCNTVAGFGADIQKSATWTADKMSGSKTETPKSN